MKDFNRDEFLNDLKAVLDKHKVIIDIGYDYFSDMTDVYDLHFNVVSAKDMHHKQLMRFEEDTVISSYEINLLQQGDEECAN